MTSPSAGRVWNNVKISVSSLSYVNIKSTFILKVTFSVHGFFECVLHSTHIYGQKFIEGNQDIELLTVHHERNMHNIFCVCLCMCVCFFVCVFCFCTHSTNLKTAFQAFNIQITFGYIFMKIQSSC